MVDFPVSLILWNLLLAARWTVLLSLMAFAGGGIVGLALLVLRLRRWRGVSTAVATYVQVFQGTPLLIQLFLAYFGLGLFGFNVPAWVAAAVALTLYASAYLTEIWRGCVDAIPRGQWEAADSLALSFGEKLRHVVGAAGAAHRRRPHRRLRRAGDQGHGARVHHRLHRVDEDRHDDHQRHVPSVHGLWLCRPDVLRAVLADLCLQQAPRKKDAP